MIDPYLKWAGGKRKLAPLIAPFLAPNGPLPRGRRYYEPFVGAGGMALHMQSSGLVPPGYANLSDANHRLMACHQAVRDDPLRVVQASRAIQAGCVGDPKEYYLEVRATFNSVVPVPAYEDAGRLIWLNKSCFNGLYRENSRGQFNVPFGRASPTLPSALMLGEVAYEWRCTRLACCDFQEALEEVSAGDTVYCDPPYVPFPGTRGFTNYNRAGFGMAEQLRLRDVALWAGGQGARLFLSNHLHEVTEELYADFQLVAEFQVNRSVAASSGARKKVREGLWRTR